MNTRHLHVAALAALAGVTAVVAAAAPGRARPTPPGHGRLVVSLAAAPSPEGGPARHPPPSRVLARIARVTLHHEASGWRDVTPPGVSAAAPLTLDLAALRAPALPITLALADLPAGRLTGLRLHLAEDGHAVVPAGGAERAPLHLPGGAGAGVEVAGPWTLPACGEVTLRLDLDVEASVRREPAAAGAGWSLRPVLRASGASEASVGCEAGGAPTSGAAGPGPAGAACAAGTDCLSGACRGRRCLAGGAAAPCGIGADCASGACDEGRCAAPAGAKGEGAACADGPGCLSGACAAGRCAPGGQGASCRDDRDCAEAMACRLGACGASRG